MWDAKLQEVVYVYSTAIPATKEHIPFDARFRRVVCLPVDFNAASNYDADDELQEFMGAETQDSIECSVKHQRTKAEIKKKHRVSTKKQKGNYDTWCCILLQCWHCGPEKGLKSDEVRGWQT